MAAAASAKQNLVYEGFDPELEVETYLLGMYIDELFDDEVVEAKEFIDARTPEAEIYGRSLGTIYRLGRYLVGKVAAHEVHSPEAEQARREFYTSVEEGFGTDMELGGGLMVRDFDKRPVRDGKVMAKDSKTAVSGMTEAGLICAEEKVRTETARGDYRFVPQLIRSKWDHKNALIVDAMARGETDYTTRIVASPFPQEAAAASGSEYWRNIGYVPHLRRGFIQLYHVTEDGEVVTGSLSFDGSNKEKLREVFGRHGIEIPETEITDNWLQYAITGNFTEEQAKALALELADQAGDPVYKKTTNTVEKTTNTVDVTRKYRPVMDAVFSESYVHACESLARGYQTPAIRQLIFALADKAGSFNDRYAQALYRMRTHEQQFTDDDMIVLHELLVYSTIEMMRALHTGATEQSNAANLQLLNQTAFQNMLAGFGAEGAINNRTYSACGLSISPGDRNNLDGSPQSAFGGADGGPDSGERQSWKLKWDKCVVPGCPTRPGKVLVGPCGVCMGRCQKLYDEGKDPTKGLTARRVIGESVVDRLVSQLQRSKQSEFELAR